VLVRPTCGELEERVPIEQTRHEYGYRKERGMARHSATEDDLSRLVCPICLGRHFPACGGRSLLVDASDDPQPHVEAVSWPGVMSRANRVLNV
jgi:hypothetical protein